MSKLNMKKILIAGLQKSGKTSIILSLEGKHNLMSYFSLAPTPGLQIKELESQTHHYILWEMGGQEFYREKYFANFAKYTEDTQKMIYVIDIQSQDDYKESLEYLRRIIQGFKKLGHYPEISVFLHKFDPEIRSLQAYSEDTIQKKLIDKISEIITPEFDHDVFKTTIFTVFRKEAF